MIQRLRAEVKISQIILRLLFLVGSVGLGYLSSVGFTFDENSLFFQNPIFIYTQFIGYGGDVSIFGPIIIIAFTGINTTLFSVSILFGALGKKMDHYVIGIFFTFTMIIYLLSQTLLAIVGIPALTAVGLGIGYLFKQIRLKTLPNRK